MDLNHWISEGRCAAEADRASFERGTYETPATEAEARSDLAYWIRCDGQNERALAALTSEEQEQAIGAAWSAYVTEWPGCPALATAPACSSCGSYPAAPGSRMCAGCAGTGLDQHEAFAG